MSVYFWDMPAVNSASQEPYLSLLKKLRRMGNHFAEKEIRIPLSDKEGFSKGFYSDQSFVCSPELRFVFAEQCSDRKRPMETTLIHMIFSFKCTEENYGYYQPRIKALKKRVDYFFIPYITRFGFDAYLNDRFVMDFKAAVPQKDDLPTVCCCLLNQIIAILAFED